MAGEHFDVVIVGSGFGGSVMAYRLGEAGKRVCVLERGKKHPPGKFPRVPQDVRANFWDPSRGLYGMYNVWFFRRVGALVSSGLGGGSLIYANVMLRKDERWFDGWPLSRAELDPHYDAVAKVLQPTPFPYDDVVKVNAFREVAGRLAATNPHLRVINPDIAVTFGNAPDQPIAGDNLHGAARRSCTLCGECIVGCNVGAKNTLDLSYLDRKSVV